MNKKYNLVEKVCHIKDSLSDNNWIIAKNLLWAFFTRGFGLIISMLSVPAFIRYFNDNTILGVWYTMLSVLQWFLNFDLGLGNGIRNNLVQAFIKNDRTEAKSILSSGFFSIGIITVILSIIGMIWIFKVDLNSLFNVSSETISIKVLATSTVCIFAAVMLRFFLTVVNSIFYALQLSSVNNFLAFMVSVLQYVFIVFLQFENPEEALVAISVAYFFVSNVPILLAAFIIFRTKLKDCKPSFTYIKKSVIKRVLTAGGYFFACQILYMLILNTNEFFITLFFEPSATTEYTLYYKTTSLIAMLVSLVMTPVWSVVTKAITENDWEWLNKLYKMIKCVGVGIVAVEFLLIPFLQMIMNVWLGDQSININVNIAFSFACFGSVFVYSSMLSTIVCGMGRMKLQLVCYAIGVLFKFAFMFIFAQHTQDWSIVVWCNVGVLLPYCIAQQISLDRLLKNKKNIVQLKEI